MRVVVKAMVPEKEVLQESIQGMRRELYGLRNRMYFFKNHYFKRPVDKYEAQANLARKYRKLEKIIDQMMLILIATKINSTKKS